MQVRQEARPMTAQARDLIMWVGAKPYPSWRSFAYEAQRMGVCKRVRQVPRGIVIGVSKCYLLHGERVRTLVESTKHQFTRIGQMCRFCGIDRTANSQNPTPCRVHKLRRTGKPKRAMYGYFVIDDVLIVGSDLEAQEKLMKAYPETDFCFKSDEQVEQVEDRGCGKLSKGAIYLRGPLTEYPEPKPWNGDTFVGFRYYTEAS